MDLILDFGNTNRKFAVFGENRLKLLEIFPEVSLATVRGFMEHHPGISRCILSSVIRHPSSIARHLSSRCSFIEMSDLTPVPITVRYKSRRTLGNDRLAAAVAAANLFPEKDVLVINAGTCITYDFVSAAREYLGGGISPGITMRFRALHTFTGKLPLITFRDSGILTGRDTEGSILSGVLTGATAEIEGIAGRYRSKYPGLQVILSGGDHKYFDKRLKISIFALPNIVIHGLHQILAFNAHKTSQL
jgi:type III pantothenate kinase